MTSSRTLRLAGALLVVIAACGGSGTTGETSQPAGESTTVASSGATTGTIDNFAFSPDSLSVSVGDTVTWTNKQAGTPHTVTADDGSFDSGNLATDATFSQTFDAAGTFAYHCTIHPSMTGTVTVAA
jgi:plastocyanin